MNAINVYSTAEKTQSISGSSTETNMIEQFLNDNRKNHPIDENYTNHYIKLRKFCHMKIKKIDK